MVKYKHMKAGKYIKVGVIAGMALCLVAISGQIVRAQTGEDSSETQVTTQSETEKTRALEERLATRKAAQATRLTTAQTARLKGRCVAAQAKLMNLGKQAQTHTGGRLTAYQATQTKLTALAEKLSDKVSTNDLEAALSELSTKITAFETASATYWQTLADLVEVDCTTDPTGFRASLDTVKSERTATGDAAKAVRAHLKDVIKPLLQDIRSTLAAQQEAE